MGDPIEGALNLQVVAETAYTKPVFVAIFRVGAAKVDVVYPDPNPALGTYGRAAPFESGAPARIPPSFSTRTTAALKSWTALISPWEFFPKPNMPNSHPRRFAPATF